MGLPKIDESRTTLSAETTTKNAWIFNPRWDLLLIFSSFWSLAIAILLTSLFKSQKLGWNYLFLWISGAHLLAPLVIFALDPLLRKAVRLKPSKYILLPSLYLCLPAVLGVFAFQANPKSQVLIVNFLALFYLIWNAWHFTSHHRGVLTLYRVKARAFSLSEKKLDNAFSFFLFALLLQVVLANHYSSLLNPFLANFEVVIPEKLPMEKVQALLYFGTACAFLTFLWKEFQSQQPSRQRILYALMMALQVGFTVYSFNLFYVLLISLNHWITELALSTQILKHQPSTESQIRKSWLPFAIFVALLIAFRLVYDLAPSSSRILDLLTGTRNGDLPNPLSILDWLLLSFYFSTHFLHMLFDRYIFSFRLPEVKNIRESLFK